MIILAAVTFTGEDGCERCVQANSRVECPVTVEYAKGGGSIA
jgi:hypothetical protein